MSNLKERIQYRLYVALMSPLFFVFFMFPTKIYFDLRYRTVTNHLCSVLLTLQIQAYLYPISQIVN
jgi:hypothetical protein